MPLKKSAILFILLSVSSVSLLVYSSATTPTETGMPIKYTPAQSCNKMNESKTFSPLNMISQIMLHPAA